MITFFGFFTQSVGQEIKTIREKSMVTGEEIQITFTGEDVVPVKDSLGRYIKIYTRDDHGTMYGNKCAEDVIKSMGFLYVIVPKTQIEGMSNARFFWNNMGSNFRLFFRNGPFWKKRLHKRLERCKDVTSDHMG